MKIEAYLYNQAISDSRKALPAIFAMWEKDMRERVEEKKIEFPKHQESWTNTEYTKMATYYENIGFNLSLNDVLKLLSTNPNKEDE